MAYDMTKKVSGEVEFILIGAGLPRTGTASTFTALEQLLPGRCHHMLRAFSDPEEPEFWSRAALGDLTDTDWLEFIKARQLSAAVDYPMSLYWRDLARLYPQAKVVLTVRDPVRWFQSVTNTIRQVVRTTKESWLGAPVRLLLSLRKHSRMAATFTCSAPTYLGPRYPAGMFGAVDCGQETAVRFFNEWVDQVKAEIPAERLLVFQVKEGWGPLCQFLGVPEPEGDFPNVNDTQEQLGRIRMMRTFCYICWSLGMAAVGVAGYYLKNNVDVQKMFC